jgi:hypothetical protein
MLPNELGQILCRKVRRKRFFFEKKEVKNFYLSWAFARTEPKNVRGAEPTPLQNPV